MSLLDYGELNRKIKKIQKEIEELRQLWQIRKAWRLHAKDHLAGKLDPLPWGHEGGLDVDLLDGKHANEIEGGISYQTDEGTTNWLATTSFTDLNSITIAEAGTYLLIFSWNYRAVKDPNSLMFKGYMQLTKNEVKEGHEFTFLTQSDFNNAIELPFDFDKVISNLAVNDVIAVQAKKQNTDDLLRNYPASYPETYFRRLILIKLT